MDIKYRRSVEIDSHPLRSLVEGEKGSLNAVDATAKAIKTLKKREEDIAESIHRTNYQNLVLENAARAYGEHPSDIEGYRKSLRESLKDYPIPPNHRHEYAAILNNGEARYFLPLMSGKANLLQREESDALLSLADSMFRDSVATMGGTVPPAAGGELGDEIAGDGYVEAVSFAATAAADGNSRAIGKANDYAMGILDAHAVREMEGMEDPTAAVEKYGSGEAMEVALATSAGPLVVSSSSLPAEHRAQLKNNIYENARNLIGNRKDREHLASGLLLMKFPATYRGTGDNKRSLDMFGSVQLTLHPLAPDTVSVHMNHMMTFAKKFSYVPDGYVEEISARVNGVKDGYGAALWSTILCTAIENGGEAVATQFPKNTLLRAYLIHDLVYGEGMDPGEALTRVNALQQGAGRWENVKEINDDLLGKSKSGNGREEFYGTAVTAEKYGWKGVEDYDRLFRTLYITNGQNISNARKVAKKCLDAVYGTTTLGHYGKGWWNKRKVKYPPEAYYPSSVVRDVIAPELKNDVIPFLRDRMGYGDLTNDNYVLMADDATTQAFYNKGRDASPPAWEIWYVTPRGDILPIFDGNGNVVTYFVAKKDMEKNDRKSAILSRAMKLSRQDIDDSMEEEIWQSAMDEIRRLEREGE